VKNGKPPASAGAFVKLPRHLLESPAWRGLSINGRRLVDFLMIEHMRRGGQHNGSLRATYNQLKTFGISNRSRVAQAITEAEAAGIVHCRRGGMRVATTYTLTWLPVPTPTENQKSGHASGTSQVTNGGYR
jgi:hypothetical protein